MWSQGLSFQRMAELSPLGMVIWSAGGGICEANRAFFEIIGRPGAASTATNYWEITAAAQKQHEINHLLTREREPYEKEFLGQDGRPRSVQIHGFVLDRSDDQPVFAAILRPISGERGGDPGERERVLRQRSALLFELGRSETIGAGDFTAAVREITEAAAHGLQVSRASVWLYDEGRRRIVCQDLFERDSGQHFSGAMLDAEHFPNYFAALAEDRTIIADDAQSSPATREFAEVYLKPLGIVSMLEVPLRSHGKIVGVLCHEQCRERRLFTEEDALFAGNLGDFLARAMEAADRLRAEQALERMNQELEQRVDERAHQLEEATALVLDLQREITEAQLVNSFAEEMHAALSSATSILHGALGRSAISGQAARAAVDVGVLLGDLFALIGDRLNPRELDEARALCETLIQRAETVREIFIALRRPIDRAMRITTEILEYSQIGQSSPGRDKCSLPEIVQEVIDDLRPQLEQGEIDVELDLRGPHLLYGAAPHFSAVVRNVIENASEALCELGEERRRRMKLRYRAIPAGALLTVEDNGIGMDDEVRSRIFLPFMTTKPGTHTGIGMAMVRKVMSLYEGRIDIDSVAGEGTRVKLLFPAKQIVGSAKMHL